MTDDLSEKLSGILSDPEAMKEIASLASQLGVDAPGVLNDRPQAPDHAEGARSDPKGSLDLQGLLRSLNTDSASPKPVAEAAALTSLLPLLGSLRQEDDTTRLLDAMRPFLSEERQTKLDRAKRLIKVLKLMPMLRELPLFE
ncbi:hypothetical protein [Ruminococcus sp.]|uniref:hypothetical protein n=1 Tax=Ruminococcus sp. TaxID=41978 RepID=UPI00388EF0FE